MFHKNLGGQNLHPAKANIISGTPVGNVTPSVIGEFYWDTVDENLYLAIGLTNISWMKVVLAVV